MSEGFIYNINNVNEEYIMFVHMRGEIVTGRTTFKDGRASTLKENMYIKDKGGIEMSSESAKLLIDKWCQDRRNRIDGEYQINISDFENDCEYTNSMFEKCCDLMKK